MTRQAWIRRGLLIILATAGAIAMLAQEGPAWSETTWWGLFVLLLTALGILIAILLALLKGGHSLILGVVRPEMSEKMRDLEKSMTAEHEAALEKHNHSNVAHHGVLVSLSEMQGAINRVCERQDRMSQDVKDLVAEVHASRKDTQDMREYLIRFKGTLVDKDQRNSK